MIRLSFAHDERESDIQGIVAAPTAQNNRLSAYFD